MSLYRRGSRLGGIICALAVAQMSGAVLAQDTAPADAAGEGDVVVIPDAALPPIPQGDPALVRSPVVTLDQDAMFSRSAFGQRVQQELERDRAALAQENRRIEAALVEEELALTQQRESITVDEFTRLANEFDQKVQQVRQTQDSKSIQLQQRLDRERQAFLSEAAPILAELVRRRGAVVVIDRNAILLSFEGIDITVDAIAAIDSAIGAGQAQKLAPPTPLQRPGDSE